MQSKMQILVVFLFQKETNSAWQEYSKKSKTTGGHVVGSNQGNWALFLSKPFHPYGTLLLTSTSHFHGEHECYVHLSKRKIPQQHTRGPTMFMKMYGLLCELVKIKSQVVSILTLRKLLSDVCLVNGCSGWEVKNRCFIFIFIHCQFLQLKIYEPPSGHHN